MIKSVWVRIGLMALMCFALVACGSTQVRVVEKQTYIVTEVDEVYLNDCEQAEPPPVTDFKLMAPDSQIDVLTKVLITQYKLNRACSSDKKSIRELIAKQKKAVAERNAAEEARVKAAQEGKQ